MVIQTECGILCYIEKDNESGVDSGMTLREILQKLKKLQNRGRDCYGVSLLDKTETGFNYNIKYRQGLINEEHFNDDDLNGKSTSWLCHVRYSTTQKTKESDLKAQPLLSLMMSIDNSLDNIYSLAHNGNIPKYVWHKVSNQLSKYKTLSFRYQKNKTDTENLTLLINDLSKLYPLIDAKEYYKVCDHILEQIIRLIPGTYCIVIQLENYIKIVRDRYGTKPIIIGKKKDNSHIIISSETTVFDSLDNGSNDYIFTNVDAGELISIDKQTLEISHVFKFVFPEMKRCVFEYIYFMDENTIIDDISVSEFRKLIAKELCDQIKDHHEFSNFENFIICGIPSTGKIYGEYLNKELGTTQYKQLISKNPEYIGRTFILPNNEERYNACKNKFIFNKDLLDENITDIIIVDDSIVRGNSMKYLCKLIKDNCDCNIHIISASPPITYPCHYGVDFPDIEELIINQVSDDISVLQKEIGAKTIIYLEQKRLDKIMKNMSGFGSVWYNANDKKSVKYCDACFTSKYIY